MPAAIIGVSPCLSVDNQTGGSSGPGSRPFDPAERILQALDTAALPEQMNVPGWRFHGLSGKAKGRYAVDASGNWRITFGWDGQDAIDVDLEDYH